MSTETPTMCEKCGHITMTEFVHVSDDPIADAKRLIEISRLLIASAQRDIQALRERMDMLERNDSVRGMMLTSPPDQ